MYSDKNQWYMSPPELIEKMIAPYIDTIEWGRREGMTYLRLDRNAIILEPSAGNGAICDYIVERFEKNKKNFRVIERDPELQAILLSKGYRLVDSDFLNFDNVGFEYDYVFMNPPFNEGAKHLLKAWDMISNGDIVCVLNAETLRTPHTADRQRLMTVIHDYNGEIEWIGQPFKGSEQRTTSVECAIVRLKKRKMGGDLIDDLNFSQLGKDATEDDAMFDKNALANPSLIKSLVAQYGGARQAILDEAEMHSRYEFYMRGIGGYVADEKTEAYKEQGDLNDRLESLRDKFWSHIFNETNIASMTTSAFQIEFQKKFDRTRDLSFTVENIRGVLAMFFSQIDEIMSSCIEDVFDLATTFHDKNCVDTGWKTNKAYFANKKIILPYGIKYDRSYDFGRWSMARYDSKTIRYYRDIDLVLCNLAGMSIDTIPRERTLEGAIDDWQRALNKEHGGEYASPDGGESEKIIYSSWMESHFFRFKFFKSGTTHIEVKDVELWAAFNKAAFARKKWVMQDDLKEGFAGRSGS